MGLAVSVPFLASVRGCTIPRNHTGPAPASGQFFLWHQGRGVFLLLSYFNLSLSAWTSGVAVCILEGTCPNPGLTI